MTRKDLNRNFETLNENTVGSEFCFYALRCCIHIYHVLCAQTCGDTGSGSYAQLEAAIYMSG